MISVKKFKSNIAETNLQKMRQNGQNIGQFIEFCFIHCAEIEEMGRNKNVVKLVAS